MKALFASLALLLLAAAGPCRADLGAATPLDDPTDITPVELIDASLGPLSELAARTGLSLQDAATLVAARAATVHSTAGGAADGMATRGLGDLIGAVPDAVSDVIDWGRWQLSYYKCIAKCIVGYKPSSSGKMVERMVDCVLNKCNQ
ncbi:hypothetical protein COHA_001158 [Chlorella ohadii]|uniref:Uncharacterized protein n=1 Tax=Chlorella ohadii TaxID=2649997 RepID=A0AAD5H658_9CHLO|nr:hypothetical protein COHA_001158 [Chlorella ohadii]